LAHPVGSMPMFAHREIACSTFAQFSQRRESSRGFSAAACRRVAKVPISDAAERSPWRLVTSRVNSVTSYKRQKQWTMSVKGYRECRLQPPRQIRGSWVSHVT